ncbi:MAG TPA: hypothetical protein VFI96_01780 [Longimicrobiaceae bacterium]|nr:hypothetical protein [Longimicrobiaceae bacterium]
MTSTRVHVPAALVTLRAYRPAPARVELAYRPLAGRVARTAIILGIFWGAIPFLIQVPPYLPWALGALAAGAFLGHREWHGRWHVHSFAGICPRCGHPLSMGVDHSIDLPHTLTCFHCHFEPQLEVSFDEDEDEHLADDSDADLHHCDARCVGRWELRWLADAPFMVCDSCHAGSPATRPVRRAAARENLRGDILAQLTREGRIL